MTRTYLKSSSLFTLQDLVLGSGEVEVALLESFVIVSHRSSKFFDVVELDTDSSILLVAFAIFKLSALAARRYDPASLPSFDLINL